MYTIMHVKIVKYFAYISVYYKEDVMREVVMNQKTNLLQLEEHFYLLVDVKNQMYSIICFLMMKFQRLRLMTVSSRIICRKISGSQIRHSVMDSSQGLLIQRNRS